MTGAPFKMAGRHDTCARWSTTAVLTLLCLAAAACSSGSSPSASARQLVSQGLAAEQSGNVSAAFADYKAAVTADPNDKYAHYDLGYVYQARGDEADAAAEYLAALRIDPRFAQPLYNMGVLETKSNPTSAISYYERELQVDPNDPTGNFNLGVLLIQQGQKSLGDSYLATGLRLNPSLSADLPSGITAPPTSTTTTKP